MTLACEDGNLKLVKVVTVVEVDDEKHVGNSLVQIWKINFGHKVKFCSDFEDNVSGFVHLHVCWINNDDMKDTTNEL